MKFHNINKILLLLTIFIVAKWTASCTRCQADRKDSMDALPSENRASDVIRFVHFNIKELSTSKLLSPNQLQTETAAKILARLNPDLLSVNELQWDQENIPKSGLPGNGQNIYRLLKRAYPVTQNIDSEWQVTFAEANTGKNAQRLKDGNYPDESSPPSDAVLADPINFGLFPGQYSTAFAARFPIKERIIINSLKWLDFNPSLDLREYLGGDGKALPKDMPLFDKNFNHSVVEIKGEKVDVITLHTVPAHDFGNQQSPNYDRNYDQLAFLEWYLFGGCELDSESPVKNCKLGIKPISAEARPFIVVGDLNVDINSDNPGAEVLRRIFTHPRVQNKLPVRRDQNLKFLNEKGEANISFFSDGIDYGKMPLLLDYFIVSRELTIFDLKSYAPASDFELLGCYETKDEANRAKKAAEKSLRDKKLAISYRPDQMTGGKPTPFCLVSANSLFAEFRQASDHLPVILDFGIKK